MGISTTIQDGSGTSKELKIDINKSALVTNTGIPIIDSKIELRAFSSFLLDENDSEDMLVVGSVATPLDFEIGASTDGDRYITSIAFTIADAGALLNKFGNVPALTVGCQLIVQDKLLGEVIVADSLKSNFDFVQLCAFKPAFGDGASAFKASNVIGASEAFLPIMDVKAIFGLPHGLHLRKSSTRKLIFRIQDDVSGVDRFDIKVFGFDRVEDE